MSSSVSSRCILHSSTSTFSKPNVEKLPYNMNNSGVCNSFCYPTFDRASVPRSRISDTRLYMEFTEMRRLFEGGVYILSVVSATAFNQRNLVYVTAVCW